MDAGGIVDPFVNQARHKARISLLAMHAMGYDAANIGENDIRDMLAVAREHRDAPIPFLASTFKDLSKDESLTMRSHLVDVNGIVVGIVGLAPLTDFGMRFDLHGSFASEPLENTLLPVLNDLESRTDIILALSQFELKDNRQIMEDYPSIDVMVMGGGQHEKRYEMELIDGRPLVQGYYKGERLGVLTLTIGLQKKGISASNKMLPLDEDYPDDPTIKKIITSTSSENQPSREKRSSNRNINQRYHSDEMLKLTPEEFLQKWKNMDKGQ